MVGKIHYDDKNYAMAFIQFEKVINIYSGLSETIQKNKIPEAQMMISKCKMMQGNYQQAIDGFNTFISDNPKNNLVSTALIGIGTAHWMQGDTAYQGGNYSTSLTHLNNAIAIYTDNKTKYILLNDVFPDAYYLKAEIYIKQGDNEQAKTILEELIQEFRMSPIVEQARQKLEEL